MRFLINEGILQEVADRAIVKGNRIIVPFEWRLNNTFAFPIEAVVDDDGKVKRIRLYDLRETYYGTLEHDPFISTVFKDCKIGKGEGLSLQRDEYTTESGMKRKYLHVRKILPDGRILDIKDLFWTWIVVMAGSKYNGFKYKKFEDFAQKRIQELRLTDVGEGVRRLIVAWFTSLSIALGMIKLVIPEDFYLPVGYFNL